MDDMDSGQEAREGMMSAAVSFLRYFLLKIAPADYFYELWTGVHKNKSSFSLRFANYPGVFSTGNAAISPAGGTRTEENPEAGRYMASASSEFS